MAVCQFRDLSDLPAIMTVQDVEKCLGIHKNGAYELIRKPGFPAVRVSERRIVIPRDRFLKWLDNSADAQLA